MITHQVSQAGFGVQEHSPEEIRGAILGLEGVMRQMPQVTIEPTHAFAHGLYSRSILIPKGTLLTGKVHKQDDLQIMVYGDCAVKTELGEKRLQGFHMFPSKAGYKQIGLAHEDTLWVTVHATTETDLDRLEELLFEDEPRILDFKTGAPQPEVIDYYCMLAEAGITHETAWAQSQIESDRIDVDLPGGYVGPSKIHGVGVFAARDYSPGSSVGAARVAGLRTQSGRYTNHSHAPNAQMVRKGNDIELMALALIPAGEEITTDYRTTLALSSIKGAL